jgi:hypothetical protein
MKDKINVEEFDRIFDEGQQDVLQYADLSTTAHINRKPRKVNVDMPEWMIQALDDAADNLSINRQAIIKVWLAERIKQEERSSV